MPVCTTCAHRADHLYTTYRTKSNVRLNVCPRCSAFLDPLIEHPPLLLILDLILLKPRVFLHLLYNRGTLPLDATQPSPRNQDGDRERDRTLRQDLIRLLGVTLVAETLVRSSMNGRDVGVDAVQAVVWTVGILAIEMMVQYLTTLGLALLVLWRKGWWTPHDNERGMQRDDAEGTDGRKENFKPILIPLTLLYTSILPLLLHLLLSIWSHSNAVPTSRQSTTIHLPDYIPAQLIDALRSLLLVWHTTDRIWGGTRLLGGMSAGFGLRVVLPTKPWETTVIVLAGWAAAAGVGYVWV